MNDKHDSPNKRLVWEDKDTNNIFVDMNNNVDTTANQQVIGKVNINIEPQNRIKIQKIDFANKPVSNENTNNEVHRNQIYLNKTVVDGKNIVDDDDLEEDKLSFKDIINKYRVVPILLVLAFICVCIVVVKVFYFSKKVDEYEEFFTEITYKEETMAKVFSGSEMNSESLKKMAASELVNCIQKQIDTDNLPDNVSKVIDDINNYYNSSYDNFSFAYKDLFTGFTVSYNANQAIFSASAIKGPTDIYLYEMASEGKVDLDEMVTYTGKYYNEGSGVLKNKPIGTSYSVRTLLEYSTVSSDNAAHNILMDKYGRENMLNFWSNLGTTAIFTQPNNWGVMNANDAIIYMTELYDFYVRDDTYGDALMKNFLNAYPTFLNGKDNNMVANKSGWSGSAIHDVAIIFASNPYIVVALSNKGEGNYESYFNKVNELAYKLHEEYWKYKMSTCEGIKQY